MYIPPGFLVHFVGVIRCVFCACFYMRVNCAFGPWLHVLVGFHTSHSCMVVYVFVMHLYCARVRFCVAYVRECTYLCAFPCVYARVGVYVCVCIYKGEVRGRRGDDMHVSGLLTSLTTRTLTDCPPSRHDGCTGKPTAPLPLSVSQIPFLAFPLCVHLLISHWMFHIREMFL